MIKVLFVVDTPILSPAPTGPPDNVETAAFNSGQHSVARPSGIFPFLLPG